MATFYGNGFDNYIVGTYYDDYIYGGYGDDTLDGRDGEDTLKGEGDDDDLYGDDNRDDLYGGDGDDYLAGENGNDYLEGNDDRDTLLGGNDNDRLRGGDGDDDLWGGNGNDNLDGDGEEDYLDGGSGNDTLSGGQNSDTLYGVGGNDKLNGGDSADTLNGGTGADTMNGGQGNDYYLVDNRGDVVTEDSGNGDDEVNSSVSFTLKANVEKLVLSGSAAINGTGNNQNNHITGNNSKNLLNGSSGVDTLVGKGGNDTYVVDNSRDVVSEGASKGTDQVNSNIAWTLGANLENLFLTGGASINGTGNGLNNKLTGNTGHNILNGAAGNDSLAGSGGKDTLNGANNPSFGKNEIDTLTGGTYSDVFRLGLSDGRLYDNRVGNNPGKGDYALITDFTRSQNDRLQLDGTASQYFLGASPVGGVPGTALYYDSNGNGTLQTGGDELIAIIRSPTALNAANTINTAIFV